MRCSSARTQSGSTASTRERTEARDVPDPGPAGMMEGRPLLRPASEYRPRVVGLADHSTLVEALRAGQIDAVVLGEIGNRAIAIPTAPQPHRRRSRRPTSTSRSRRALRLNCEAPGVGALALTPTARRRSTARIAVDLPFDIRQDRSGRGSSLCPRQRRSRPRTAVQRPRIRTPPRSPGAASSTRR